MDKHKLVQGYDQVCLGAVWRACYDRWVHRWAEKSKRSEQLEELLLDLAAKQPLS